MNKSKIDRPTSNDAIRLRIIEFAQSKFGTKRGWKVQFQKALGLSTIQQLSNILRGKNPITQKFILKVVALGANHVWLESGIWLPEIIKDDNDLDSSSVKFSIVGSNKKIIPDETPADEPRLDISIVKDTADITNRTILDQWESVTVTESTDDSTYPVHVDDIDMEEVFKIGDILIVSKNREIEKNKNVPVVIKLKQNKRAFIRFCTIQDSYFILTCANNRREASVVKKKQIEYIHRITVSIRKY